MRGTSITHEQAVTIREIPAEPSGPSWRPDDRFAVIETATGIARCCRTLDEAISLQTSLLASIARPASPMPTAGEW